MNNSLEIKTTSSIGFLIGVSAWSMTFLTLIWGYLFFRLRSSDWLSGYVDHGVVARALGNTITLGISSWMFHQYALRKKPVWHIGGTLAGAAFIILQWRLWQVFCSQGLTLQSSMAGSFLYLLTGFHALHILIGLALLVAFRMPKIILDKGDYAQEQAHVLSNRFSFALRFWDLLFIFWMILFVLIFLFQ